MICPARPVSMPPRRSARNRLARCTQNASGNDPVRADQGQGFPHARSASARTENRRVGAAARPVGRDAVACRRRGCPARKDGRPGPGGRQAATGRRVAKIAAGASAQRPGIADPRDAAAKSQPDARRRRLRETRRNGFRAAGPGWQAGARGAQARRGTPAPACQRIHGTRRTGCRARSRAERRACSRGPDARAEIEGHRCARSRSSPRRGSGIGALRPQPRHRSRQPPRALAGNPAAQRARLDCVSCRAAEARAPRRLVVQVLRHRPAREAGCRRVPCRRTRQPAPWRGHRATHLPAEARATVASRRDRDCARRQGHLLRHGRNQPQAASRHVHDARRHAGQLRRGRLAARADTARSVVSDRLLARNHREPDRSERVPPAGNRARAERGDHPGRAQRRRGPHGAGGHADARLARKAAFRARFRDADRRLRQCPDRSLRRRVHQPRGPARLAATDRTPQR